MKKNRKNKQAEPVRTPIIRADAPPYDHWYLVPHRMGAIAVDLMVQELKLLGFEYYRPMMQRMGRPRVNGIQSTTLQVINEPLFPGYIFVRHHEDRKARIARVYGVAGLALGAVHNDAIELLKRDEETGWQEVCDEIDPEARALELARTEISPGVDVEVKMFGKWCNAVVAERLGTRRVALLTEFMGRQTRFVVALSRVIKAADRAA